jgi:hypothetical protein
MEASDIKLFISNRFGFTIIRADFAAASFCLISAEGNT